MSREQYRKGQFLRGGNFPLIRNGALDDTDAPTAARANLDELLDERALLEERMAALVASLASLRARSK